MGSPFIRNKDGCFIEKEIDLESKFDLDANHVHFYQIMGLDANKILQNNEKHRYSLIKKIPVDAKTARIGIRVFENDVVECAVLEPPNDPKRETAIVSDQEIADANDEHYTWILQ